MQQYYNKKREIPTFYKRFSEAIEVLTGKKPPANLIKEWLNQTNNDLQDWIGKTNNLVWCQNIVIIDAAYVLANGILEGYDEKTGVRL